MYNNILIIDDNQFQNYYNKNLLKNLGLYKQISIVNNGLKAISYLHKCMDHCFFPDLILLDIVMPKMDGISFLKYYNQHFSKVEPKPKIIIITGGGENFYPEKLIELGVEKVLFKPLSEEKILGALSLDISNINTIDSN